MADIYRIEVEGAAPLASRFTTSQRRIQDTIIREWRRLQPRFRQVFLSAAPEDRGFRGGIKSRLRVAAAFLPAGRPAITVRGTARDPESGFAYLRVSRYGHRKMVIKPKHARALAVRVMGHRNPHIIAWRPYVEGSRPDHDWVEVGAREADTLVRSAEMRLGREIVRAI